MTPERRTQRILWLQLARLPGDWASSADLGDLIGELVEIDLDSGLNARGAAGTTPPAVPPGRTTDPPLRGAAVRPAQGRRR